MRRTRRCTKLVMASSSRNSLQEVPDMDGVQESRLKMYVMVSPFI